MGNSLNYLDPIIFDGGNYTQPITYHETVMLCGLFNSFPVDFILRRKVSTNMNIFFILGIPIPRYDRKNHLHKKLVEKTAQLICTTEEYEELKKIIDITSSETESTRRFGLEAQINAISATIYGLDKSELEYILKDFPIVSLMLKKEVLNEFDKLQSN